jgi:hypothetical protein
MYCIELKEIFSFSIFAKNFEEIHFLLENHALANIYRSVENVKENSAKIFGDDFPQKFETVATAGGFRKTYHENIIVQTIFGKVRKMLFSANANFLSNLTNYRQIGRAIYV